MRICEHHSRRGEIEAMLEDVGSLRVLVPFELHARQYKCIYTMGKIQGTVAGSLLERPRQKQLLALPTGTTPRAAAVFGSLDNLSALIVDRSRPGLPEHATAFVF